MNRWWRRAGGEQRDVGRSSQSAVGSRLYISWRPWQAVCSWNFSARLQVLCSGCVDALFSFSGGSAAGALQLVRIFLNFLCATPTYFWFWKFSLLFLYYFWFYFLIGSAPANRLQMAKRFVDSFVFFQLFGWWKAKKKNKKWLDLFFLLHFNLDFLPLFISFLNYCYLPPAWATFKSFFSGLPSISFGFIYLFIPYSTNHKAKKTWFVRTASSKSI